MTSQEELRRFYEGDEWAGLYGRNPDSAYPAERVDAGGAGISLFHGRVPLSFWLKAPFPLPSLPVTFWGSPVTDLFPVIDGPHADSVRAAVGGARKKGSWAIIVKDLPSGSPLEEALIKEGFVPVDNDPVWYTPVCEDLKAFLDTLSRGRRKGLEGRWKRFVREVSVRPASPDDLGFMKKGYDNVRDRSEMRLETLSGDFFSSAMQSSRCRTFIFEKGSAPFAFVMLWEKDGVWFDKYMGTDDAVYREVSFYSMSILYLMSIAPANGINLYVAGQGCGRDKEGLGFRKIDVRLWIRPLVLRPVLSLLLRRFMGVHGARVFSGCVTDGGG